MAMDLLQLTVLALNLATEHSMAAISGFVCDRIPGALSPLFGWIVFLLCAFHLDDIHFSSRRAGSDKLMSVCDGGICIFIPLNKREMSSGAPRILLCDRNHIIDWHTESCPSNSPWRVGAASEENKGRFEADRVSGQTVSHRSGSRSLCVSATLRRSPRGLKQWGNGIMFVEYQVGALFPVSKYSRCHLCSFELLHRGRRPVVTDMHPVRLLPGIIHRWNKNTDTLFFFPTLGRFFYVFMFWGGFFASQSPGLLKSKLSMTISGIVSVLEGFTGITFCLKVIGNIELPLRSIAVKQNLLVLQPETKRLTS